MTRRPNSICKDLAEISKPAWHGGAQRRHLSGINALKADKTGRRTLWIAALTLLAAVLIPAWQIHVETANETARENAESVVHTEDVRRLDLLQQELHQEHMETVRLEQALFQALAQTHPSKPR